MAHLRSAWQPGIPSTLAWGQTALRRVIGHVEEYGDALDTQAAVAASLRNDADALGRLGQNTILVLDGIVMRHIAAMLRELAAEVTRV